MPIAAPAVSFPVDDSGRVCLDGKIFFFLASAFDAAGNHQWFLMQSPTKPVTLPHERDSLPV